MAYYGNLALRPERVEERERREQPAVRRDPVKSKAVRRRTIPIGEKLLYLAAVAAVVFVASFVIFRYAQIYQINGEVQEKNRAIELATEQSKELQKEVERLSDPERFTAWASEKGLVPIAGNEIKAAAGNDANAVAMNR
ncbi:cell division protein FtsL [Cohnella suwonensis]|uniref:Cell division protein FtsL n=1 Tax=Cohnella suwonensis TaxID=696072 RepID=A0ABW0LQA4_9BACL